MSSNLDFNFLHKLYQSDPDKFEQLRLNEIEKLIGSASEDQQKRLRGLQFQIDAKREIHKNSPMAVCVALSKMMHDSFESLRSHLNDAASIRDPLRRSGLQNDVSRYNRNDDGKVIQFRK